MMTLQQATKIAVFVEDDTGKIVEFLTALTALVNLLVAIFEVGRLMAQDVIWFVNSVQFTFQVWDIWIRAFLFGAGMRI